MIGGLILWDQVSSLGKRDEPYSSRVFVGDCQDVRSNLLSALNLGGADLRLCDNNPSNFKRRDELSAEDYSELIRVVKSSCISLLNLPEHGLVVSASNPKYPVLVLQRATLQQKLDEEEKRKRDLQEQ